MTTSRKIILGQRTQIVDRLKSIDDQIARASEGTKSGNFRLPGVVSPELYKRKRELEAALLDRDRELAVLDDQDAADSRAKELVLHQTRQEETAFWFRRFFTSLAIGHGAAFAALAAGTLQSDDPTKVAAFVALPMSFFAWGVITAGLIPFALYLQAFPASTLIADGPQPIDRYRTLLSATVARANLVGSLMAFALTVISAVCFAAGLSTSVSAVSEIGSTDRTREPVQVPNAPRPSSSPTVRPPPAEPSTPPPAPMRPRSPSGSPPTSVIPDNARR